MNVLKVKKGETLARKQDKVMGIIRARAAAARAAAEAAKAAPAEKK